MASSLPLRGLPVSGPILGKLFGLSLAFLGLAKVKSLAFDFPTKFCGIVFIKRLHFIDVYMNITYGPFGTVLADVLNDGVRH